MRRLGLGVLLLGVSAWVLPATSASAFEGTLKWRLVRVDKAAIGKVSGDASDAKKVFAVPMATLMSMHGEAQVTEATVFVKGSKVRTDTTARDGQSYFITDLDTGVTLVVTPAEKKVMEIGEEDVRAMEGHAAATKKLLESRKKGSPGRGAAADPEADAIQAVPLGRTETISGMPTSAYELQGSDVAILGWVTAEHPDVLALFKRLERNRAKMGSHTDAMKPKEALAQQGLPVRVQTLDQRQYLVEDLVQVDEKPVSDDLFLVPADFARTSARQLMQRAGQLKKP